jgi:hypothetical protein
MNTYNKMITCDNHHQQDKHQQQQQQDNKQQRFSYRILPDYLTFMAFIICCSAVSIGFIPSATTQNSMNNSEKIEEYSHHKTTVNLVFSSFNNQLLCANW